MLGLISSHMHQSSLSQHPVTEGILFSLLRLNFISLLLFLLKTISEWEWLICDNSQLSTHLSIHSFISLLPLCTSRDSVTSLLQLYTVSFISKTPHDFWTCILQLVSLSQCPFVLHPPLHTSTLSDNTAIFLVIQEPSTSNTFPI